MQSHDEVLEVIDDFNTYIWGKGRGEEGWQ
jgi:hypothetical protein